MLSGGCYLSPSIYEQNKMNELALPTQLAQPEYLSSLTRVEPEPNKKSMGWAQRV